MIAIETNKLTKKYGDSLAVKEVSLTVNAGEVFSLLGPNGAGKTTTVEILEGHRTKTSGEVKVLGMDPFNGSAEFRSKVGIVLQETGIEQYLTASEILEQFTNFYETPREIPDLLEMTGLTEEKNKRVTAWQSIFGVDVLTHKIKPLINSITEKIVAKIKTVEKFFPK